ncbi:MAG: hypothetical protein OXH57_00180 [Ekhidna sp.]|nr:hypothetical protein [Ekhidna sp.]
MAANTLLTEGTAASFTVSASPAPDSDLTVNLTVARCTQCRLRQYHQSEHRKDGNHPCLLRQCFLHGEHHSGQQR